MPSTAREATTVLASGVRTPHWLKGAVRLVSRAYLFATVPDVLRVAVLTSGSRAERREQSAAKAIIGPVFEHAGIAQRSLFSAYPAGWRRTRRGGVDGGR